MKKKLLALILGLVLMFTFTACGGSDSESGDAGSTELNIFMWSDYLSDDVVADFENETGIKVNLSYMNDNADSVNKLTAGAGDEYDLIMTCDAYMESLINGGYLEELDLSQIPNSENINKAYWSEQNQKYCVPYLMNYIYVVYDTGLDMMKMATSIVLIGLIGNVIDTSIAISSALYEVHTNNPKLSSKELFKSGMNIGKDILGTTTNTLFFAYLGSCMTLFIYFQDYKYSFETIINSKIFAIEFTRIMISGLASFVVIPITAIITAMVCKREVNNGEKIKNNI